MKINAIAPITAAPPTCTTRIINSSLILRQRQLTFAWVSIVEFALSISQTKIN